MSLLIHLPLNGNKINKGLLDTTISTAGTVAYATGKVTPSAFNSAKGNIEFNLSTIPEKMSIAFWLKPIEAYSWTDVFSFGSWNTRIEKHSTASLYTLYGDVNNLLGAQGSYCFYATNGVWTHIAVTIDGSNIKYYVNGNLYRTETQKNTLATVFGSSKRVTLGTGGSGTYYYYKFNGYENDFRLYDHVLSAKEIKELSIGLCLHYKLDNLCGKTWINENLVANSKTNSDWTNINSEWTKEIDENGYMCLGFSRSGSTSNNWKRVTLPYRIPKSRISEQVTISFDLYVDVAITNTTLVATQQFKNANTRIGWTEDTDSTLSSWPLKIWKRYSRTYTQSQLQRISDSSYSVSDLAYTMFSIQLVRDGSIKIRKIKLEYGTKATDYCPNYKDQEYLDLGYNTGRENVLIGGKSKTGMSHPTSNYNQYSVSTSVNLGTTTKDQYITFSYRIDGWTNSYAPIDSLVLGKDASQTDAWSCRIYPTSYIQESYETRRYYGTKKVASGSSNILGTVTRYILESQSSVVSVSIYDAKIELGSTYSDWSPCSKDSGYNMSYYNNNLVDDCSGYGNNGKTYDTSLSSESVIYDHSNKFNGNSSYINAGQGAKVSDELSVSVWAYMSDWTTGNYRLVSCTETGGWNFQATSGSSTLDFIVYASDAYQRSGVAGTLESGWHHFVGIWDGYKSTMYVDGVNKGSSTALSTKTSITYNTTNSILIGAEPGSTEEPQAGDESYFNGYISDVRVYGSAINENRILELYKYRESIDKLGNIYAKNFIEDRYSGTTGAIAFSKNGVVHSYCIDELQILTENDVSWSLGNIEASGSSWIINKSYENYLSSIISVQGYKYVKISNTGSNSKHVLMASANADGSIVTKDIGPGSIANGASSDWVDCSSISYIRVLQWDKPSSAEPFKLYLYKGTQSGLANLSKDGYVSGKNLIEY